MINSDLKSIDVKDNAVECKCDKFEVTDGERIGTCYSRFDHFDIKWEDGTWLTTIELSLCGIRKTFNKNENLEETPKRPYDGTLFRVKSSYYADPDCFGESYVLTGDNFGHDLKLERGQRVKIIPVCNLDDCCGCDICGTNSGGGA